MTGRNLVEKIMLACSAAIIVFLGWYSLVLLGRTEYLARGTSIASPVIAGFHALGVSAAVASAFAEHQLRSRYGWAVFGSACLVEVAFLVANLTGIVWEYQKDTPANLYEAGIDVVHRLMR
jgi:hypothetical protein